MIEDGLLIFIILFLLIYCMEDSFFGLFILLVVSIIEVFRTAATATETDVVYVFLYGVLAAYAFGSLVQWLENRKKNNPAD